MLFALAVAGCATDPSRPVFTDVASTQPAVDRVLIDHRIADEQTVRATCQWKSRESGIRMAVGAPGCSWTEQGRAVVLCVDPKSFNNHLALEVCGHEAYHHHHVMDHQ